MVSAQCLYDFSALEPLYTNVLVTWVAPPAFVMGAFGVLAGLHMSYGDSVSKLKSRLLTVAIFIVFIFQPTGPS